MIIRTFDIGFLFSADEGHYCCICSRCLERIGRRETALRVLARKPPLGFEEYRYCKACQDDAGMTPAKEPHPVLEQWRSTVGKQNRYVLTPAEMTKIVSRTRAERTKIASGQMHYFRAAVNDIVVE